MYQISLLFVVVQGQYGPDPQGVPSDFMCAWRQLTSQYAAKIRPDAQTLVFDALETGKYCPGGERPDPNKLPRSFPPFPRKNFADNVSIYVDGVRGDDSADGSKEHPLKTLQAGVDRARQNSAAAVVVRAGTYYLSKPITVSPGKPLTITNFPLEEVWLSRGVVLNDLHWSKVEPGPRRLWKTSLAGFDLPDIATLRVDGERINPARYPNADPEREFWPSGYLTSAEAFEPKGDWLNPTIKPDPNPAKIVNISSPNRAFDAQFSTYRGGIGGTCSIYDPPFSFWCQSPPFSPGCGGCFTWNIPSGLNTRSALSSRPGFPYRNVADVQVMAWRKAHWANWAFEVDSMSKATGERGGRDERGQGHGQVEQAEQDVVIKFGKGGFQGARGGPGSDWFVQNVMEELDQPNEFYYDKHTKDLYFWSNETSANAPPSAKLLVAVTAAGHTLLTVNGTQKEPVRSLTISGLGFRDTSWTMLQPHGVPSGGDWALERMGAVFAEGTEDFKISNCSFLRLGGNAVMLSKFHRNATVEGSSFAWLGGSAIAAWGWTDEISEGGVHGIDGTGGDFPRYTLVQDNLFREIGVWEKQSSAFFQAKTAESVVRRNLVFNLARAGFNFNDGFGGGDLVENNVLFNTCRESSDHGPINSWDRQPFVTTIRTGKPSTQMQWRNVRRNIVIANYGGSKEVDNDDGSLFWKVSRNFMVYGWGQKFKCGAIESVGNLKAYIELGGKFDAGCLLDRHTSQFYPNLWRNDTMIHLSNSDAKDFAYRQCWGSKDGTDFDATQVGGNKLFVADQSVAVTVAGPAECPAPAKKSYTLEQWLALGKDPGTVRINGYPSADDVITWAKQVLGEFDESPTE